MPMFIEPMVTQRLAHVNRFLMMIKGLPPTGSLGGAEERRIRHQTLTKIIMRFMLASEPSHLRESARMVSPVIDHIRVIDTDTHLVEPPDLWTSRMSPKYGDLIPHVEWDD